MTLKPAIEIDGEVLRLLNQVAHGGLSSFSLISLSLSRIPATFLPVQLYLYTEDRNLELQHEQSIPLGVVGSTAMPACATFTSCRGYRG